MSVKDQLFVESLANAPLLDRLLVQYMESMKAKLSTMRPRSLSVATDKTSIGGIGGGLQNIVIGLGSSNIVGLGVPQVTFVGLGPPSAIQ